MMKIGPKKIWYVSYVRSYGRLPVTGKVLISASVQWPVASGSGSSGSAHHHAIDTLDIDSEILQQHQE